MSSETSRIGARGARGRGAHSGYEGLARGLGIFSLGLGLAEMIAPRAFCKAFGMDGKETLIRAYGAREFAAGVALMMSHDPTPWMWARVAGDAADLGTLALDPPRDGEQRRNRAVAAVAVAGVTALDIACAIGLHADKRLSPPGAYDYGDRTGYPRSAEAMRGEASDFEPPEDFRIPDPLRPWTDGKPVGTSGRAASGSDPGLHPLSPA